VYVSGSPRDSLCRSYSRCVARVTSSAKARASRFPGAAQHEVMRCRPGIVTKAEFEKVPGLQCTASRCTASGKQGVRPGDHMSANDAAPFLAAREFLLRHREDYATAY